MGSALSFDLFVFTVGITFATVYPFLTPFVVAYFFLTYLIGKVRTPGGGGGGGEGGVGTVDLKRRHARLALIRAVAPSTSTATCTRPTLRRAGC